MKVKSKSRGKSKPSLRKDTLEKMLAATYDKKNEDIAGYQVDNSLSGGRVKVYHDPKTKHTVVAHRGSAVGRDWVENALYVAGIKRGKGWRISKEKQDAAYAKYGAKNITTIGHSKGALHAQEFGKRGKEIITLNKPVNVTDALFSRVPQNQIDYTGEGDIVSVLRPLQRGSQEVILSKEKGLFSRIGNAILHPIDTVLKEHGVESLRRLPSSSSSNSDNSPTVSDSIGSQDILE